MTNYRKDYYKAYSALRRLARYISYARFVDSYAIYFKEIEEINLKSLLVASDTYIMRDK